MVTLAWTLELIGENVKCVNRSREGACWGGSMQRWILVSPILGLAHHHAPPCDPTNLINLPPPETTKSPYHCSHILTRTTLK